MFDFHYEYESEMIPDELRLLRIFRERRVYVLHGVGVCLMVYFWYLTVQDTAQQNNPGGFMTFPDV